jgi:hypothetical protein
MRITGLAVLSPVHLPRSDINAIEALLRLPTDAEGRHNLEYHGIAVEAHAFGFFLGTAAILEDFRAPEVSATLWGILSDAEHQGCDWVLIDRDEPAIDALLRFD